MINTQKGEHSWKCTEWIW